MQQPQRLRPDEGWPALGPESSSTLFGQEVTTGAWVHLARSAPLEGSWDDLLRDTFTAARQRANA